MSYDKTNWVNEPSTVTPLSAANLNKMETQYDAVAADVRDPTSPVGAQLSAGFARRNKATLYPEAYGAKGDGVNDDTTAIRAMVTAANALVDAGTSHVVFQFDAAEYLLASPAIHPDGANGAHAQIPLPKRASSAPRAVFEFRGVAATVNTPNEAQTAVQESGTILRSTATGGFDGTYGLASVIGGPTIMAAAGSWTNVSIVLDGLTIRRPDNPSIAGADFTNVLQAKTINVVFDTNTPLGSVTYPTHNSNIALMMPAAANNALSGCQGDTYIFGAYVALRFSEHFTADHLVTYKNKIALAPAAATHGSIIHHANLEWSTHCFADIDPILGPVSVAGSFLTIPMLDVEDGPAGAWAPDTHILDASDAMRLDATYVRVVANVGQVAAPLTFTGTGATHRLSDLVETGAWIAANLGSGWVNTGLDYAPAAYRITRDGYVELRGGIKSGASATAAFSLPAALAPTKNKVFSAAAYPVGTLAFLDIGVNGGVTVLYSGTTPTLVSLDGIRFKAEA